MKARGNGSVHHSMAYANELEWISKEGERALEGRGNPGHFPGGSYICLDAKRKDVSIIGE